MLPKAFIQLDKLDVIVNNPVIFSFYIILHAINYVKVLTTKRLTSTTLIIIIIIISHRKKKEKKRKWLIISSYRELVQLILVQVSLERLN